MMQDDLKQLKRHLDATVRAQHKVDTELDAAFAKLNDLGIDPEEDLMLMGIDYNGVGDTLQEQIDFAVMHNEGTVKQCMDIVKEVLKTR